MVAIDAAVHEAERVCRTHDAIKLGERFKAVVHHLNIRQLVKMLPPSGAHSGIRIDENEFQAIH
ncbi:MAG: hypothetical protein ACREXS_04350 [Gammaproteobacteria bacterium]